MPDTRTYDYAPPPSAPPQPHNRWRLVRGAWKILVAIKDLLVLIAILIFFAVLFAALNARSGNAKIGTGALLLKLDGSIVEQPQDIAPFAVLSGRDVAHEFRLRDVVRAIDAARDDNRVKAVVLDLDGFGGGYPAALDEVAEAMRRVRVKKPVLTYATAYTDGEYRLAAAASEIWMNPLGGTIFTGPGGNQLYYKGLIDKLGVDVHVYRVGKFKSFVEPYIRSDQSPDAKAAAQALYGSLFGQWRDWIAKTRPKAQVASFLAQPEQVIMAANGNIAQANVKAGIVDHLGDRVAFGRRIAQIAGVDGDKPAGSFRTISYQNWIDNHPLPAGGDAIGVVTIAGNIVDGKAGPGTAAGDTISKAVLDGLAQNKLKALVVRVDSPGGSALASEQIRQAILTAKKQGLPVIVSMGSIAASGGYWVSTAGDMIFAEPETITGSIGIFGIVPTFEKTLAKIGVTSDGVKTTPLSGQPDVFGGTNPAIDAILQSGIENGYREFIARVAGARHMTPERVNEIAQGRVWDGGTARQIGLVDRFGTLSDAVAEAAKRAKLDPAKTHLVYLEKKPGWAAELARSFNNEDESDGQSGDIFARIGEQRRETLARAVGDLRRLTTAGSIQARCLECEGLGPSAASPGDMRLLDILMERVGF